MASIDLSLPPDEVLIQRINDIYNRNFSLTDVYFDLDSVESINYRGCDTQVIMRGRRGSAWAGALRVYYNRINLTKYLADQIVTVPDKITFTGEARPHILKEIGIRLDTYDIVSDVIPPDAIQDTLRISKRSLIYSGTITLSLMQLMKDRIANPYLNGFYANSVEVPA